MPRRHTLAALVLLLAVLGCPPAGLAGAAGSFGPSPEMAALDRALEADAARNALSWERIEASIQQRSTDLTARVTVMDLDARAERFRDAADRHRGMHRILTLVTGTVAAVGAGAKVSNEYWISGATILTLWRTTAGESKAAESRAAEACESASRTAQATIDEFTWATTNLVENARESDADASRLTQVSQAIRERHAAAMKALAGLVGSCPRSVD